MTWPLLFIGFYTNQGLGLKAEGRMEIGISQQSEINPKPQAGVISPWLHAENSPDPGWFIAEWCEFTASESRFHGPWRVWLAPSGVSEV